MPTVPKLERSQITASFIVENAKGVAGISIAVLAAGVIVMVLLSLLGNAGLGPSIEPSTEGAYTVATVEVHAHKKVGASSSPAPGVLAHTDKQLTLPLLSCCAGQAEPAVHIRLSQRQQQQDAGAGGGWCGSMRLNAGRVQGVPNCLAFSTAAAVMSVKYLSIVACRPCFKCT